MTSSKKPRAVLTAGCPSLLPPPRAGLMAGCPGGLSPSWSMGRSGLSPKPLRVRVTHNAGTALCCEQALSLQLLGGGLPGDKGGDPGLEVGNMLSPPPAATPWTRRGRWLNRLGCRGDTEAQRQDRSHYMPTLGEWVPTPPGVPPSKASGRPQAGPRWAVVGT